MCGAVLRMCAAEGVGTWSALLHLDVCSGRRRAPDTMAGRRSSALGWKDDRSSFELPVRRRGVASFWTTRRRTTPIVRGRLKCSPQSHETTSSRHHLLTPDADHWRLKRHEPREEHRQAAFGTAALYICNGTP